MNYRRLTSILTGSLTAGLVVLVVSLSACGGASSGDSGGDVLPPTGVPAVTESGPGDDVGSDDGDDRGATSSNPNPTTASSGTDPDWGDTCGEFGCETGGDWGDGDGDGDECSFGDDYAYWWVETSVGIPLELDWEGFCVVAEVESFNEFDFTYLNAAFECDGVGGAFLTVETGGAPGPAFLSRGDEVRVRFNGSSNGGRWLAIDKRGVGTVFAGVDGPSLTSPRGLQIPFVSGSSDACSTDWGCGGLSAVQSVNFSAPTGGFALRPGESIRGGGPGDLNAWVGQAVAHPNQDWCGSDWYTVVMTRG